MFLWVDRFSLVSKISSSHWFRCIDRRTALFGLIVGGILYSGLFIVPGAVAFSYADDTCASRLLLLPDLQAVNGSQAFKVVADRGVTIGRLRLATTRVCFEPTTAPVAGTSTVAIAPFGSTLFSSRYSVTTGQAPKVIPGGTRSQALSRPLALSLSQPDQVFNYVLSTKDKHQPCTAKAEALLCPVDKLGLVQGTSYTLQLKRTFAGNQAGATSAVPILVLPAATVTASSIKPDEFVVSRPKAIELTLDKPALSAFATLTQMVDPSAAPITVKVTTAGTNISVGWTDELPRESAFRLTLSSVTTADGSTLAAPFVVNFRTSGGPKVTGINIGASNVSPGTRVVITFDQALATNAAVGSFAKLVGGTGAATRLDGSRIAFDISSVPRCGAFSLNVAPGLMSESGIASNQPWSFASRLSCRLTRTIGYSVRGRPINAYFYGNGPTTILFTGGIHGSERSGMTIMEDWAAHLDSEAYRIPAGKQVVIVPNMNPDGIAIGARYNANNVNLDRNYPTSEWVADISLQNGVILPNGGGATPLSEPESRALVGLVATLNVRAEFSFHSAGALVGANKFGDSVAIGNRYASGVRYGTMFDNPESIMGYTLTGELETWLGERYGIPAVLIELPTATGRYFSRHQAMLWAMVGL